MLEGAPSQRLSPFLAEADAAQCVKNAISVSFLPTDEKAVLLTDAEVQMLS